MQDKIKIIAALLVFVAGVVLFMKLPVLLGADVSGLVESLAKIAVLLVSLVLAFVIVLTSGYGKDLLAFVKGSQIELRKMVWPSMQETRQTTLIVMVVVVMVALFLWLIDAISFKVIYGWLLGLRG